MSTRMDVAEVASYLVTPGDDRDIQTLLTDCIIRHKMPLPDMRTGTWDRRQMERWLRREEIIDLIAGAVGPTPDSLQPPVE